MTICETVARRVRELLDERKISLYKLTKDAGIINSTMQYIMSNKNKTIELGTVIQIAGGFNMSVGEFLSDPIFAEENFSFKQSSNSKILLTKKHQ